MEDIIFELTASSPEQTEKVGADLARMIVGDAIPALGSESSAGQPMFVALRGDLGAGKTAFVRGMATVLAPNAAVSSPTYALVNVYEGGAGRYRRLCHFDLYRLESEDDLESIGYYDYETSDSVIAVEWFEKIPSVLPKRYILADIRGGGLDGEREITVRIV